ncbi:MULTISPECIES: pentapeptide repeat-containing protein [Chitinophaga]|uniref:pentapeptide repeat-containing protein n=1 Tax=Chitinophaga TaxID=79328 RepID=UPI0013562D16|nr:pentapeptide repeat-containing protein [Chitinophaga ginsengisegetis]
MAGYDQEISHEHKKFEHIIWEGKTISGREFYDCHFYKCSLKECVFEECVFDKCTFEECDLSLIQFKQTSFNKVILQHSKAIGIAWHNARNALTVEFHHSRLSYCNFSGKNLKKGIFLHCQADEADFSGCNLSQADFGGTDLAGARFFETDLTQANFAGAQRYAIDVRTNKVKKAKFSLPDALSLLDGLGVEIVE